MPNLNKSLLSDLPVQLGSETDGNYIATIAGTANEITVTGSGSETAAVTISLPANVTISNNLTVTGDLTVSGNTTTINTANLFIEDNIILLNSGETSTPTLNAGIEVERGTSTNVSIRWNESTDKWEFTNDGSTYTNFGAGGATISETAPASPVAGQVWFESDTAQTYVYYDSQWIEIGASPGVASVSNSAPNSPAIGQFWFVPASGATNIYYDSQWIEIGAAATSTTVSINTAVTVGSFNKATYRSAEFTIQVTQGSKYTTLKALVLHDGTTAQIVQYGLIEIGVPVIALTIAADISGADVRLLATITNAATTNATVKVLKTVIAV